MQNDAILIGRFRGALARIARARARPAPGCFPGSAGGRRRRDAAGPCPEPGSSARAMPGPRRSQPTHFVGCPTGGRAPPTRSPTRTTCSTRATHTHPPCARPPAQQAHRSTDGAATSHQEGEPAQPGPQPLHSCGQTPSHAAPASQHQPGHSPRASARACAVGCCVLALRRGCT